MQRSDRTRTGMIFNIQKFSVNDGPGIRTAVFFKGCPLRCRWCANPESQLLQHQILWDRKKCIGCQHCVKICPAYALSMENGQIRADAFKCTVCGQCIHDCPKQAFTLEGKRQTVQEVLDIVLQDRAFYEESGGGITLTGGEILAQPDFAVSLALAAKEEGLHTCCETTGYASPEIFDCVMEHMDYILFDLKHWDAARHKEGAGVTNERILSNLKHAVASGKEVLPRIPVIPGFNDSQADAAGLAGVLYEAGAESCQLLPFHQFGENKYRLLGKAYAYEAVRALHQEDLQDYLQVFDGQGIRAFF